GLTATVGGGVVRSLREYFFGWVPSKAADIQLFLAAGMAGYGLSRGGYLEAGMESVFALMQGSEEVFTLMLPLIILGGSMLGITSLVMAILVAGAVSPIAASLAPVPLAISISAGVGLTMLLSPVSGT